MDQTLTDEHVMILDMARAIAQREIAPVAAACDESGEFPHTTVARMGQQGFMEIEVRAISPEGYGKTGMVTLVLPVANGQAAGAYALTGPQSGSEAGNTRTVAESTLARSAYVLRGPSHRSRAAPWPASW